MLRISRVYLVVACFLIATPLGLAIVPSGRDDHSQEEGRTLSPWPALPRNAKDWRALPRALDAFLADHFGLRESMTRLQSRIAYLWLEEANSDVLIGGDDRLFYYGDQAMAQSAGALLRTEAIARTVDMVSVMQSQLAERGIKLVVGFPPNAASVYQDSLPDWARRHGRETEPDVVIRRLKARGTNVVDLGEVLRAARDRGKLYLQTDTHWSPLGTVIGLNALAAAAGHPDWAVRPESVIGPPVSLSGDLSRMLGVGSDISENLLEWTAPSPELDNIGSADAAMVVAEGIKGGPSVLIVGDLFSEISFETLLASHAGRMAWLYARDCGFDWSWIDRFKPDEVWWVPTERLMLCNNGAWPPGLPHGTAKAAKPAL